MPVKSAGSAATSSTTHAPASSRRARVTARSGPRSRSARSCAPGTGARARPRGRVVVAHDERAPAVGARAVQRGGGRRAVVHERGAQATAQHGGQRTLAAGLDLELVGERPRAARRALMQPQRLVAGGQLGADPGGLAACGLDVALGVAARRARGLGGGVGLAQLGAAGLGRGLQLLDLRRRRRELALQRLELAGQLPLVLGGELGDLRLQVGDARGVVGDGHVLERLGLEGLQATGAPLGALRGLGAGGPHALEALRDPVGGGPRRPDAAGELLAPLRALRPAPPRRPRARGRCPRARAPRRPARRGRRRPRARRPSAPRAGRARCRARAPSEPR